MKRAKTAKVKVDKAAEQARLQKRYEESRDRSASQRLTVLASADVAKAAYKANPTKKTYRAWQAAERRVVNS